MIIDENIEILSSKYWSVAIFWLMRFHTFEEYCYHSMPNKIIKKNTTNRHD